MISWIISWWRAGQRAIDVAIFWPACIAEAGTRGDAKVVFRVHMEIDPAYSDMSDSDKYQFVEALP